MSKKNKRYVLYRYSGYTSWYGLERELHWSRRTLTRSQLITNFSTILRIEPDVEKYITTDMLVIPERCEKVPDYSRPGVKQFKYYYHTVYCLKVLKGEKEVDIDLKALFNECLKVNSSYKPKKRNHKWHGGSPCWKKQYRCKHQWEIHQRKKVYVFYFNRKEYDLSWEEVS